MTLTKTRAPAPGRLVPYVLAGCTAVSVLSTDVITPSIPDLPADLGTDIHTAQMTVSINLLAYALAQLIHGPVADTLGRQRLLVVAFSCFAVVSVFCALATNIDWLLTGRFLQGLFSSVPSVVIVLMIRELYDPQKALKVMALYGAALGIAPAVGPLIGGYLHIWFGWHAGFWLIVALALLVLGCVLRLVPESLEQPRPFRPLASFLDYLTLLKTPAYLGRSLGVSALFGAYFAYVTSAPVIFIDLMGLPNQHYGLTHVFIIAAYIAGNVTASRLSGRFSPAVMIRLAAFGSCIAVLLFTGPVLIGFLAVPSALAAMMIYGFSLAFVLAAGPLTVLDAVPADSPQGPAAALLGSLQLATAALAGYFAAVLYDGTALPLALVMTICVLTGAVLIGRAR